MTTLLIAQSPHPFPRRPAAHLVQHKPARLFPADQHRVLGAMAAVGRRPAGYHLVNLALHVSSVLPALAAAARAARAGRVVRRAAFRVASGQRRGRGVDRRVQERPSRWCSTSAALLCYVRRKTTRQGREGTAVATRWRLGLFVLAVLSKSVGRDAAVRAARCSRGGGYGRVRPARRGAAALPFFVVSLAAGLTDDLVPVPPRRFRPKKLATRTRRLAGAREPWPGGPISFYLGKLLWPRPLAMIYPRWKIAAADLTSFLWPAGVAALLAVTWWGRRRWGRAPAAALA